MKVIITGANSAVGQAILRHGSTQAATPSAFIAAVRSRLAVEQIRSMFSPAVCVAQISYDEPASLDTAFQGASAVIHLAGILVESRGSTYEQANVASTRAVVDAAKRNALQKFVLVSGTGADEASSNRYYSTKGQAEALVRASGLCYTVLRAPLLLGRGTEGAAALRRNASRRKAMLINGGRHIQQPLCVDDLARAAIVATQPSLATNLTLDLVGPVSLTERQLVERTAHLLGRKVQIGSIPKQLLSLMLAIRRRFSSRGFSKDVLEVITADTRLVPQQAARELGIELTDIEEMIKRSLIKGDE